MSGTICGVILAAGRSRRLGRPKQLLDLGGEPLLRHVVRSAIGSRLDDVVLVLGHEAAAIAGAVGDWGQRVVVNPDFAEGQSTSVRAGLAALDPAADAVMFLLGDQPQVTSAIIDVIVDAYRETHAGIVVPTYGGVRANPVLFASRLYPELAGVEGDQGARAVVRARAEDVVTVEVNAGPPPGDVDTDEDYLALLASWTGQPR